MTSMGAGENVQIRLHGVKDAPYSVFGKYVGSTQLHERGTVYVIVEGTHGDDTDKVVYVPETLIHTITVLQ